MSHVLSFPPHADGYYISSALCSCGEFQWDADTGDEVVAAADAVQRDWEAHVAGDPAKPVAVTAPELAAALHLTTCAGNGTIHGGHEEAHNRHTVAILRVLTRPSSLSAVPGTETEPENAKSAASTAVGRDVR